MKNKNYSTLFQSLILSILVLQITIVSAQNYEKQVLHDSLVKVNGIAIVTIDQTFISKRGKTNTTRVLYHFDRAGNNTNIYAIADTVKHKRIISSVNASYAYDDIRAGIYQYTYYQWPQTKIIEYFGDGRTKAIYWFKEKGKSMRSSEYFYTDSLLTRLNSYNKRHRLSSYYTYVYQGKKLKQTSLYNAKGKIIRYWDYNCDDEGKIFKKSKDSVKICEEKSYLPDGNYIKTTNSFNYKGEPVKYVEHRNAKDVLLKYLIYTGKDQILTYKYLATYENNVQKTAYKWIGDTKGRNFSSKLYVYNSDKQITQETDTFYRRNKPEAYAYTYTFNEKGLPLSKKGTHDGQLVEEERYIYLFYKKDRVNLEF